MSLSYKNFKDIKPILKTKQQQSQNSLVPLITPSVQTDSNESAFDNSLPNATDLQELVKKLKQHNILPHQQNQERLSQQSEKGSFKWDA